MVSRLGGFMLIMLLKKMNKRVLHHFWVRIRPVSYWYFLAAFLVFGITAIYSLRQNNLTAINLRNKVYSVDQNDGDVNGALNNLRSFVFSHMNTNLATNNGVYPPIQLKYTYERLQEQQVAQVNSSNAGLYTRAENYCQSQIPTGFSGRYRISCIDGYIQQNGAKIQPIPAALYEFDFQSPFWSPDLAGWSIVASCLFFFLFVVRFILELWLKNRLKQHA